MKQKHFITIVIIGAIFAIAIGLMARSKFSEQDIEKQILTRKLSTANQTIEYLEKKVDTLEIMVKTSYDSAVLFEIIVGVKEPNGIVEYKEKLMIASKNIHKLNRAKLK